MKKTLIISGIILIILIVIIGWGLNSSYGSLTYAYQTIFNKYPPQNIIQNKVEDTSFNTKTTLLATIPYKYPKAIASCSDFEGDYTCARYSYHDDGIVFSKNGRQVAYSLIKREGNGGTGPLEKWVIGGVEQLEYTKTKNFVLSPDGKQFGYVITKEQPTNLGVLEVKDVAIIDGKEGREYPEIDNLVFSPDSKNYAYKVLNQTFSKTNVRSQDQFIVLNGQDQKKYPWVSQPSFTDNKLTYIIADGKYEGTGAWKLIQPVEISTAVNSTVQFRETLNPKTDFINFTEHIDDYFKKYNISISSPLHLGTKQISPDGNYLGYGVRKGNELWWVVEKINTTTQ